MRMQRILHEILLTETDESITPVKQEPAELLAEPGGPANEKEIDIAA